MRRALRSVAGRVPLLRRLLRQRDAARGQRDALRLERDALRVQVRDLRGTRATLRERVLDRDRRLAAYRARTATLRAELAEARTGRPGLGYLFVVSHGRSGSTLVQGILCSIPGFLIRGENGGVLHHLFEYHRTITARRKRLRSQWPLGPTNPWHGIDLYQPGDAIARIRAFVLDTLLRPAADTRVCGFKEIRWWQDDWQEYLTFLRDVFPGARFVISTRDHASVANSKWWADEPDALEQLAAHDSRLTAMRGFLGEDSYVVHYDEFVADPASLAGLFDWLGEPMDLESLRRVLDTPHSY